MSLRRMMFAGLNGVVYKNWALASNGATIYSNIAPDYGSVDNLLLGTRSTSTATTDYLAYWDLTTATEDLVLQVVFTSSEINKIVAAWGINNIGTIAGSGVYDETGIYFPNYGQLTGLKTYLGPVGTDVTPKVVSSRLQEFNFTTRSANVIEFTISKDIGILYLCGIEVWGN